MQISDLHGADFAPYLGIDMASLGEFGQDERLRASYGVVAPGAESTPQKHDETEAFVILSGYGEIIADGQRHPVQAGSVALFEPFESHVLRNTGVEPLRFADFYWRDAAQRDACAANSSDRRLAERPIFVFSTPPTPNGDLHLGHLSGPYLGADIYVRFLRATGHTAYHLTGSDDFQSYVVGRARQEESSPQEVADRYSSAIRETLDMMDISLDQYTVTSHDAGYEEGLRGFFTRLVEGGMRNESGPALFDGASGAYLHEVDVGGNCPSCGASAGGNICEECGEPNTCIELDAPRSKVSEAAPVIGSIKRYTLNLSAAKDAVLLHQRRAKISPRLRELAGKVLARADFRVAISHPAKWGVSPTEKTEGEQVIWVWPEMAYGFLHSIAALGQRLGNDWKADRPQQDWKIVHFFGYDNSFYHSVLFPALYHLAFPDWNCDIDYNDNEFYLLDGLKFSTSRRHAIWGRDILTPQSVDAVRWYLAWTRGEGQRTNFTLADFNARVEQQLLGQWQAWLSDLGMRIQEDFEGRAPDSGSWTPLQTAYLGSLRNRLASLRTWYGADGFALNRVVEELNSLVANAARFGQANTRLRTYIDAYDEYRSAIALELASAKLLAHAAAPLMPRFAQALARAIGLDAHTNWPNRVELVLPGTSITLDKALFFVPLREAVCRGTTTEAA